MVIYSSVKNGSTARQSTPPSDESLQALTARVRELPVVFTKIRPAEPPATYFLELPNDNASHVLRLLGKGAGTNVFHSVNRTQHTDCLRVQLASPAAKDRLERIVQGQATVHESDPFANRREAYQFIILDFELFNEVTEHSPKDKSKASSVLTYELAREMLVKQNPGLLKSVKVTRLFVKKPLGLVFAVRDKEIALELMRKRFVNFGLYRPVATRYHAVSMCMHCCSYDHKTTDCKSSFVLCARCGRSDHAIEDCFQKWSGKKVMVKCFYCTARSESDTRHPATALSCPYRRDLMERLSQQNRSEQ